MAPALRRFRVERGKDTLTTEERTDVSPERPVQQKDSNLTLGKGSLASFNTGLF